MPWRTGKIREMDYDLRQSTRHYRPTLEEQATPQNVQLLRERLVSATAVLCITSIDSGAGILSSRRSCGRVSERSSNIILVIIV